MSESNKGVAEKLVEQIDMFDATYAHMIGRDANMEPSSYVLVSKDPKFITDIMALIEKYDREDA